MSDVDMMFDRVVNPWMNSNIKEPSPNFDELAEGIKSYNDLCKHAAWNEVGRYFLREGREALGVQCLAEALRHYPGNDSAAWTGIKLPPENPEAKRIGEQLRGLPRPPVEDDQAKNARLVANIQRIVGMPGKKTEASSQVSSRAESTLSRAKLYISFVLSTILYSFLTYLGWLILLSLIFLIFARPEYREKGYLANMAEMFATPPFMYIWGGLSIAVGVALAVVYVLLSDKTRSETSQPPEKGGLQLGLEMASGAVKDLKALKVKLSELIEKHQRRASVVGLGASAGQRTINTICGVCDDAARALDKGLDVNDLPIKKSEVAEGLRRLVRDAKQDTGVVAVMLDAEGVRLYGQYLNELEKIAGRI